MTLQFALTIAMIVIVVLLGLLFWILVILCERERRKKKWEDHKKYKQEHRKYKREMKLRRKRNKLSSKKGKFAKKGGKLHVPTEVRGKKREPKTKGSREEERFEKPSRSKELGSYIEKEPKWSLEKGTREDKQDQNKREESAQPANIYEIEKAIKSRKMLLASVREAPNRTKEEVVTLETKQEEETLYTTEESSERRKRYDLPYDWVEDFSS